MSGCDLLLLILLVAAASYVFRAAPLLLLRKPFGNRRLVAFVERLPYAILAAMIVPDAFSKETTGNAGASAIGFCTALALALAGRSLPTVAAAATAAAFAAVKFLQ